jgi:WD40 repeat protein
VCLGYRGLITRIDLAKTAAWRWREPIVVVGPNGTASSLAWSSDARLLAAGLMNGQVKVYDAATGKEAATFGEAGGPTVNAVALSPGGAAAAWCACTHLHFHRPAEGVSAHHALGKTHFLSVAWHPSGAFFATANGDGKIDYWDAQTGQRRESYDWGVGKLNAVVFDPAGDRAACCSERGDVAIWDVDR